jgi:Spy/CpxP family protein refolding chaperone
MENTSRKFVYLVAMLIAFAIGSAAAQQQPQPGNGPQGRGGPSLRLIEELALDEFQVTEIMAIFEATRALHEEERIRNFENRDAIREETHLAIMSILNEDQQARFEELLQLRSERWSDEDRPGNGNKGPRPGGPGGNCSGEECPNDGNGPGPGGG